MTSRAEPAGAIDRRTPTPGLAVTLRPFPLAAARALVAGGTVHRSDVADGAYWAEEFPSTDTIHGLALILAAYDALGTVLEREPDWWVHQILVETRDGSASPGRTVVGEAGFHGPPDPDGVVEIGYEVVPGWRRRGVATRACGLLVERAWVLGARVVRAVAEPGNLASRRVLAANGFAPDPEGAGPECYRVERP